MTAFTDAIERELKGIGHISAGLASICGCCCQTLDVSEDEMAAGCEDGSIIDEGGFSWQSCESCGSSLGGNRYAAHGFNGDPTEDGTLVHLDICEDCLLFHANGDEPDQWGE